MTAPALKYRRLAVHEIGHAAAALALGALRVGIARDCAHGWRAVAPLGPNADEISAFSSNFGGPIAEVFEATGRAMGETLRLLETEGFEAFHPPRCMWTGADLGHCLYDEAIVARPLLVRIARWTLPRLAAILGRTGERELDRIARELPILRTGQMAVLENQAGALRLVGFAKAPPEHAAAE